MTSSKKPTSNNLAANQARSYSSALKSITSDVFASGKPADRVLSAYFRTNRRMGSRDRRAVMETLFSIFRWWGWLQALGVSRDALCKHAVNDSAWARVLIAAHCLDNPSFPGYVMAWKDVAKLQGHIPVMADLPLPQKAEMFSTCFSLPPVVVKDLVPAWTYSEAHLAPADAQKLVEIFCQRPPMWIRVQRDDVDMVVKQLKAEGLTPDQLEQLPKAINLGNPKVNLYQLESFRKGRFEVQDIASQFVGLTCDPKPGERWWDACAGAGGKTLHLASLMENKGTVVASDIRSYKLKDLKKRARRAGFSNISPKSWDKTKIPVKAATFDGVLVDAPCSCSGTWRRNPDARWTTSADDAAQFSEMQLDILSRAAKAVKPGGVLVYATCSFSESENQNVVEAFLKQNPAFSASPFPHPVSGENQMTGMLQTFPWEYNSDAMFVARMIRSGD